MRVRIARDELRRMRELSQTIKALEAEIAGLVAQIAPQLLTEPGLGPLTAAKLVGEIAGADRFATDAKLARAAGLAPIPVSSGKTNRHRLDRGGNRQINAAIHRIAVTRARCHPETRAYLDRKRAEGKTTREAIRCLKRHLARRIWHLLQPPRPTPDQHAITHQFLDIGAADAIAPDRVEQRRVVTELRSFKQAIAKAEAVRGNAARLLGTPTLCLCKRRDRRSLVARMLLVDGHGVRRWAAEFVAGSRRVTATLAPRRPRARPSPPLPPVTSAPQDLRDVSAVMPVPRLPARPRAAARRLAAATARCASARGRRGGLSLTA